MAKLLDNEEVLTMLCCADSSSFVGAMEFLTYPKWLVDKVDAAFLDKCKEINKLKKEVEYYKALLCDDSK